MIRTNIANDIWKMKYRNGEETESEFYQRIIRGLFENDSHLEDYAKIVGVESGKEFYDYCVSIISNHKFMLAGRPTHSLGTTKKDQSYSNCFVNPIKKDSMEAIMDAAKEAAITFKAGGGIGYNFSVLRPKNFKINTTGSCSSGVVSFMRIFDTVCSTIMAGGNRRGAQLGALSVYHPDIEEYIVAKRDGSLSNFNLSVFIPDAFMQAVESDDDWSLFFPDTTFEKYNELWDGNYKKWIVNGYPIVVHKKMKAKELYDKIIKSNYNFAEPGILFEDTINRNNNMWWSEYIMASNPCQPEFATVLTPTGVKTFGEVVVGDIIWSGKQWTKIVNKWKTGNKKVYSYNTTVGSFIGTENHKIFQDNKRIEVKDAKTIDVCVGELTGNVGEFDSQSVMDGLVLGDGGYHKASDAIVLYISKKDHDYFEDNLIKTKLKNASGVKKGTTWKVETTITKEELVKNYNREIPDRFFKGDYKTVVSFLRGLYSANGSICGDRVTLKQSSYSMIKTVRQMLSAIGIRSYITINKQKNNIFSNGEYVCKQSYDLNISVDKSKFKTHIGFIQKYKNEKLFKICKKQGNKSKKTFEIKSVDDLGYYDVYDITVDADEHSYWTDGLLVSNCGEQPLQPYGSCNLGSLNLYSFVKNKFMGISEIDHNELEKVVRCGVIMLDRMLDMNFVPLKEQREEMINKRAIGLGFTGLADMLAALEYKYSKSSDFVEKLTESIKEVAYDTSCELAKVKGSFPAYDSNKFLSGDFVKKLSNKLWLKISNHGIRNSRLISIAPTGTISILMNNVSGGIEPIFALEYNRKVKQPDGTTKTELVENLAWGDYKSKFNTTEVPDFFETTEDLNVDDHIFMQAAVQKHNCSAISKTINVPVDYDFEDFKNIYIKAWKFGLKGCTTYRPNNVVGSVLDKVADKEIKKQQKEFFDIWKDHEKNKVFVDDVTLPDEFPMRGFKIKSEGKKWYVSLAFKDKQKTMPFAIFVHTNNREGEIETFDAINRLEALALDEGVDVGIIDTNRKKMGSQTNVTKIARMLGLLLRHNISIIKIVDVLDSVNAPISSFIIRIKKLLMNYIEDEDGIKCLECGGKVKLVEGCLTCLDCGHSKCS